MYTKNSTGGKWGFTFTNIILLMIVFVINLSASTISIHLDDKEEWIDYNADTIPNNPEALFSNLETSFDFDLDTSDIVGTVKTFNRVKLYSGNVDSITIVRTDIYITEGLYKNLRFYSADGRIFENTRFVSVSSFRHQRDDILKNINFDTKGEYIILGECMDYLWVNGNNYAPSDNSFFLDTENPKKAINVNAGLNSFIELKTYSDLLALINTEENGLVQVEASSRIIGYTRNISKKGNVYFLNYVEPSIRYSKFDNDFESISVDSVENNLLVVNRSQLNQIAKMEFELLINSFRFYTKAGHYIDINGLISYKYSDIKYRDSVNTANLVSFGLNFAYDLPRYKNFGMEMKLTTEWQYIARNSGFNPKQVSGLFNQPEWVFFWSPELTLYYSPLENRENKIYLRVSGVNTFLESDKNFSQVQLGYRTRIKLN